MADQPTVQIPASAFARLVKVAMHVSAGRSFAFAGQGPYPDATARRALGELAELGLIPVAVREEPATEPEPESCAHCGKTIRLNSGTISQWWVHEPGGHTVCYAERAASSPRATPKPAGVRKDGPRIVAYVLADRTELHCLCCTPTPAGDIWTPVTADELHDGGVCSQCGVDVLIPQDGAQPRCPAKHGALGRICELPPGHSGMHTGAGPNGGAVWDGDAP